MRVFVAGSQTQLHDEGEKLPPALTTGTDSYKQDIMVEHPELIDAQWRALTNGRSQLLRSSTDYGPRTPSPTPPTRGSRDEENWELRHGWEEQYNSEYLTILNSVSARWDTLELY